MDIMTHSGPIVAMRDNLEVISCKQCGFFHLNPIPQTDIYSNGVYHSQIKPSMESDYRIDCRWWIEVHNDWLDIIRPIAPNKNLLDVGAGTGEFVRNARIAGWYANGVEADLEMANRHGLYYVTRDAFFEKIDGVWERQKVRNMGIITAHWLLEHLGDPANFLNWAYDTLAKKGILMVTIPNDFTEIQYRIQRIADNPFYWLDSTHINYWNCNSFKSFVMRYGFEPLCVYGSWIPEISLLVGKDYLKDRGLGKELHKDRMETELAMPTELRRKKMMDAGSRGEGRDLTFVLAKL